MKFEELEDSGLTVGDCTVWGCSIRKMPIEDILITDYDFTAHYQENIYRDLKSKGIYIIYKASNPHKWIAISSELLSDDEQVLWYINKRFLKDENCNRNNSL